MNHKTIAKFVILAFAGGVIIASGITTARLSVASVSGCLAEVEPNDTAETAQAAPLPGCVDGTVDEADWYTVQVVENEFTILLQAPESQRVRLVVYGPQGKIFDWEDWGDLSVGFHNRPIGKYDVGLIWLGNETPTPQPTYTPPAAGVVAIGDSYRITFGPDWATPSFFVFLPAVFRGSSPIVEPTHTPPAKVNYSWPRDGDDYDYRVFLPLVFRSRSTVLTVCPAGPPMCGYATVQEAVDAAEDGNVIKVAAGTYTDVSVRPRNDRVTTGVVTQVVYISKTVTIRGGYTTTNWVTPDPIANPTTLDAQGQGRVLYITGNPSLRLSSVRAAGSGQAISPTIEGLRITGGDAAGMGGGLGDEDAGGGVYITAAAAAISDNQVFSNTAEWYGGGVCLVSSEATLVGNTVVSNTAHFGGGGLFLKDSDAALSDNTISANTASIEGGGLYLYSSDAILSDNTITGNTTCLGGGLFLEGSDSTLSDNTISANTAQNGGGLYLVASDAVLNNNTITTNTATFTDNPNCDGGGLYLSSSDVIFNGNTISANAADRSSGGLFLSWSDAVFNGDIVSDNTAALYGGGLCLYASDATLINTVVADNRANAEGGGLYVTSSSPRLLHTTIARNGGDGVYVTDYYWVHSTIALTNTIVSGHTVGITVTAGDTATLESTLWNGNGADTGGTGTIVTAHDYTGDPLFASDGYHLMLGSAAIDEGVDAGVYTDIDGDVRPAYGVGYDLGADEYYRR